MPSPADLPYPGLELGSPALQVDSLPTEPQGKPICVREGIYLQSNQEDRWKILCPFLKLCCLCFSYWVACLYILNINGLLLLCLHIFSSIQHVIFFFRQWFSFVCFCCKKILRLIQLHLHIFFCFCFPSPVRQIWICVATIDVKEHSDCVFF